MLIRLLKWMLASLFALVPLIVLYKTYAPSQIKDVAMVGIVAIVALGWLWHSMEEDQHDIPLSPLNLVLGFNLLVWIISLLLSSQPSDGFEVVSLRLAGVGFLLLAPLFMVKAADLKIALGFLLVAVTVMSIYALMQYFRIDPFMNTEGLVGHFRVSSTTNHPNVFISVLVAAVPLNIAAFSLFRGARGRLLLLIPLFLSLGAAVATLSRAGCGALVAAILITLIGLWRGSRYSSASGEDEQDGSTGGMWKVILPVVLVIAALVFGLGRKSLDPGERERFLSLGGPTIQKRALIYQAAFKMAGRAPIIGQGPGGFYQMVPADRSAALAKFFPRNEYSVEHGVSEPLEVLVESGALGLIGWLLLVGFFVIRPWWVLKNIPDPILRKVVIASAAGTAGLVIHSLVEVNLRFQPPLFLFWALPALGLAAERIAGARRKSGRTLTVTGWPGRLGVSIGVGMTFGLAFAMILSNYVAGYHVASGRALLKKGQLEGAEKSFRTALSAWAGNLPARYRRAYVLWKLGHLKEAEKEYREVIRRAPYYFDANHNLARLLLERGELKQAETWVTIATRINPYHVPSHELAVNVALRQKDLARAEKIAMGNLGRSGYHALTHITMAQVRIAQGRREAAAGILQKALVQHPEHKELKRLLGQVQRKP